MNYPISCVLRLLKYFCWLTGKTHLQIKLKRESAESTNMAIWVICTLNELFIGGSYTQIKFSKE